MKLFAICQKCSKESGHEVVFECDYYNELIISTECGNGHSIKFTMPYLKFEVLFTSSVQSLLHGYTIESVTVAYAAYERFIEFCIDVLLNHFGAEFEEKTRGQVAKQSERQLGGFLFLYLVACKKSYVINRSITEKRNKYVHQGSIPSKEDALLFIEKIYDEIALILNSVIDHAHQSVVDVRNKKIEINRESGNNNGCAGIVSDHRIDIINDIFFAIPDYISRRDSILKNRSKYDLSSFEDMMTGFLANRNLTRSQFQIANKEDDFLHDRFDIGKLLHKRSEG